LFGLEEDEEREGLSLYLSNEKLRVAASRGAILLLVRHHIICMLGMSVF